MTAPFRRSVRRSLRVGRQARRRPEQVDPSLGLRLLAAVGVALACAACTGEQDELQRWTEQQRREVKPSVTPLVAPKKFNPQPYLAQDSVEPFSPQKLTVALKRESHQPNSLLASQVNRLKEPLEAYPLDSMTMVGSVQRQGREFALLRVDNLLHNVKVGDYVGQNYGRISKITETDVSLKEIVQDATGDWIERDSVIQLQEKAK